MFGGFEGEGVVFPFLEMNTQETCVKLGTWQILMLILALIYCLASG